MLLTLLCAAALCAVVPQQDTVSVEAVFSSPRITVGSTTTLVVRVVTNGDAPGTIRIPDLPPALQVLGTSDYSETQVRIPGGRTRITRRDVTILARAPGVYRLGAVIVRGSGGVYRSRELQLIVTGAAPAGPDEVPAGRSSLRASVTPDTVFVGQQVLLEAEVTFAEDFRMRQSRPATFDPPAPSGFWIQDLPDPITIALRVRDGRTVESQTYRRAYFPLNPGRYRMPPARLHYEVRRGFLYPPESRELVSDSPAIVVLPLPEGGQPASFTGAVGQLEMRVTLTPERVRVGEPAMLQVELQGTGNVKALPEPRRPAIEGVEVFPATQESEPAFDDSEVGGVKRFRWMLVPEEAGTFVIPPIEYAVFDPELRTYAVLRSDSLRLEAAAVVAASPADTALRPLRTGAGGGRFGWTHSPLFAAAQALPLAFLAGVLFLRRRRRLPPAPRDELRVSRARLDALRSRAPDAAWLAELEHLLRDAALGPDGAGEPVDVLRARGLGDAADRLQRVLAELGRLRFAPDARLDTTDLLAEAGAVLDLLERRSGVRGAGLGIVALVMVAGGLAAQQRSFDDAVRAFDTGEFGQAIAGFREYTRAAPQDVNGWYNLGMAAERAGNRGLAAWAWLRAARVAPRDDDLRHNLRMIGAASALPSVLPPDRLAPGERRLAASAVWWLLVIGAGALLTGRRRAAAALLAPALAAGLVLGALLILDAARPRQVTALGSGVALHAAPTTREEALARLEPGRLARIIEIRDQWLLVRNAAGVAGWVERAAVAEP